MATHYNILDREIQGTREPGMLHIYSPWGHKRGGHDLPVKKKLNSLILLFNSDYLRKTIWTPTDKWKKCV